MIVFGGATAGRGHLNDMYSLDTETLEWSCIAYASAAPPGRSRHSMVYAPPLQALIVFGGADETQDFGDLWLFHVPTRTWSSVSVCDGATGSN